MNAHFRAELIFLYEYLVLYMLSPEKHIGDLVCSFLVCSFLLKTI